MRKRPSCLRWLRLFAVLLAAVALQGAETYPSEVVYPKDGRNLAPILDMAVHGQEVFLLHDVALVHSGDGGATWTRQKTPTEPRSVCSVDATRIWVVAADGLYRTVNGGREWRRILKSEDLLRCGFVSADHGFAIGHHKTALETVDGGKTWANLEAATGVLSDPERTSFTSIEFFGKAGLISGYHSPKRPELDAAGRQWPQLGVLIQSIDGGESWKPTAAAVFGRLAASRVGGRLAALLMQYDFEFSWPSEVYRIELATGELTSAYRVEQRRVCAVAVMGRALAIAALRVAKEQANLGPRPLELQVDGVDVPIDERLTAGNCFLGRDGAVLWLATDQGFVEKIDLR